MDIEPKYIDVAVRRWEGMTGKKAVLAETGESFAEVAERRSCADNASDRTSSTESQYAA